MKLLDLFCGAGGTAVGFNRAGFDRIVGIDIAPQPHYPFEFVRGNALEYLVKYGCEFDLIAAAPPCQYYSIAQYIHGNGDEYPKLIEPLRALLLEIGKPYVIENVPGAPLVNPVMLCGLMFGLKVFRHRLFECSPWVFSPGHLKHPKGSVTNSFRGYSSFVNGATHISVAGHNFNREDGARAMDIDWHMTRAELSQAIPPAYTEYIGRQMLPVLKVVK